MGSARQRGEGTRAGLGLSARASGRAERELGRGCMACVREEKGKSVAGLGFGRAGKALGRGSAGAVRSLRLADAGAWARLVGLLRNARGCDA